MVFFKNLDKLYNFCILLSNFIYFHAEEFTQEYKIEMNFLEIGQKGFNIFSFNNSGFNAPLNV